MADQDLREELEVLQERQDVRGGGDDAVGGLGLGRRPAARARAVAPQVDEQRLPVRKTLEEAVGEPGEVAPGSEDAVDEDDGRGLARSRGEAAELREGGGRGGGEKKERKKKRG